MHAEALAWLEANPTGAGTSVITSLPDVSEVPKLGFGAWRAWFVEAARRVIRWAPADGVAIFYQSDVGRGGTWVDKGYLVAGAQWLAPMATKSRNSTLARPYPPASSRTLVVG
ncbi:MAG TPA: hypothetical protein VFS43_03825 [Polyangiaceae bacterium]|nr:hypothetical protein [Polyangiaceae bacterium]